LRGIVSAVKGSLDGIRVCILLCEEHRNRTLGKSFAGRGSMI
jgi:hypothetical protein